VSPRVQVISTENINEHWETEKSTAVKMKPQRIKAGCLLGDEI